MLSWIVVGLFVTVTVLAAGRLLLLYRETRGLPELLIATLILGVGTFGVGGSFVILSTVPEGALQTALNFIPNIGVSVGMAALCLFTWRVYRPNSSSARAFAAALVIPLVGMVVYSFVAGTTLVLQSRPLAIASSVIHVSAMMWSAIEALLYWRAMKRRLSLGLADALVTNRFLLWGLATGMAGQGIAIGAFARLGMGLPIDAAWISLCYAAHGTVSAVCFWLAFSPPHRYARWIARGAEAN